MDRKHTYTRVNRLEKRKKSNTLVRALVSIGGILIILLLGLFLVNGEDKKDTNEAADTQEASESTEQKSENENKEQEQEAADEPQNADDLEVETSEGDSESKDSDEDSKDENAAEEEEKNEEESSEEGTTVEQSDDPNVLKVVKKDWQPVATSQQGQHSVSWDEGSQDRKELKEAVAQASGLNAGDMIVWWIDGMGPNKVNVTASASANSQAYRVYVQWVEGKGYQPTKMEVLKENDRKS